jgi:hypothetical protein
LGAKLAQAFQIIKRQIGCTLEEHTGKTYLGDAVARVRDKGQPAAVTDELNGEDTRGTSHEGS